MPDLIKEAIKKYFMPTLEAFASSEVIYTRPSTSQSVTVPATYGQKLLRTHDQFGALRIEWTDLDFIIDASLLHFDDLVLITPETGDQIFVAIDSGDIQVYEVLPFGNDAPWRWSGTNGLQYRIHTKNIRTVTAAP